MTTTSPTEAIPHSKLMSSAVRWLACLAIPVTVWALLPQLQGAIIPTSGDSITGPWVIVAERSNFTWSVVGISTFAITVVWWISAKRPSTPDGGDKSRRQLYDEKIRRKKLRNVLIVSVVAGGWGLANYIGSWTVIDDKGNTLRSPFRKRTYRYEEVQQLESFGGGRSSRIVFESGETISFSRLTAEISPELRSTISVAIRKRSGVNWTKP